MKVAVSQLPLVKVEKPLVRRMIRHMPKAKYDE